MTQGPPIKLADRTSLLILQPTPFCNIDCRYCYLTDRANTTRMTPERAVEAFRRLAAFPTVRDEASMIWHAGEPLVLGVDWYEQVFAGIAAAAPSGLKVHHCVQTNAMLIDDDWCRLFRDWKVNVGVSVDGPREMHDAERVDRKGRGTFDRTMAGIACLRRNDVDFHVISVLGEPAMREPAALFAFYRDNDIARIAFNVREREGGNVDTCAGAGVTPTDLRNFYAGFLAAMRAAEYPIDIRELEQAAGAVSGFGRGPEGNEQVEAFGIVTVDVGGGVTTFSPELAGLSGFGYPQGFDVGNVFTDDFETMLNSPTLARMAAEIGEGVEACRASCAYFPVCCGGAPVNKLCEAGSFAVTETEYCRLTKKAVMDFVLETIEAAESAA
jgi:uncharacterized protein